jgi:hypothetical protein
MRKDTKEIVKSLSCIVSGNLGVCCAAGAVSIHITAECMCMNAACGNGPLSQQLAHNVSGK